MLRCLIGKEEVNTFENDKEYFKNLSDKGVLKCPTCGTKLLYCHGDIKEPYFKHSEDCDCVEKNIKEIGQGKYDPKTNEEHSRGLRILYNSLKEIEGITDLKLEKNIKETNQRADIYFVYNDKEFVIEFQCCSNNSNYMVRHDLYKKNKITDIWILGNDNYSEKESYSDITLKSIEKQILMNDYRLVYLNVEEEKLELINSNDLGILYGSNNKSLKTRFSCGNIETISIKYLVNDYSKDFDEIMLYNMINLTFSQNETFRTTGTELIGENTGFRIDIEYNKDIINNRSEINKKIREFILSQKEMELYFYSEDYNELKHNILKLNNENCKITILGREKGTYYIKILFKILDFDVEKEILFDCKNYDVNYIKNIINNFEDKYYYLFIKPRICLYFKSINEQIYNFIDDFVFLNTKYDKTETKITVKNILCNNSEFSVIVNRHNYKDIIDKFISLYEYMIDYNNVLFHMIYKYYSKNTNLDIYYENKNKIIINYDISIEINNNKIKICNTDDMYINVNCIKLNDVYINLKDITQNYLPNITRESLYK